MKQYKVTHQVSMAVVATHMIEVEYYEAVEAALWDYVEDGYPFRTSVDSSFNSEDIDILSLTEI